MVEFRFEALPLWPHEPSFERKSKHLFRSSWGQTLALLKREVAYHTGDDGQAVIQAGFRPADIRRDGLPRADAKAPAHPGVIIQFLDIFNKPITFSTDAYETWQANVRALALSMQALRAVDRWGATQGRQWAGFMNLLPPGEGEASPTRGERIVNERFDGSVKRALKALHPDHGGVNPGEFRDVQAYRDVSP